MEAGTIEQNLQAAAPAAQTVGFYSRGRGERLVRRPQVIKTDGLGRQETLQEPLRIDFAPDGRYTATVGKNILLDTEGWLADDAELERRGQKPRGEPRDEVEALRSHKQLNVRFWEDGAEPDRVLPLEEDFIAELTRASMAQELETVEGMLEEEQATHNRPVLVKAAQSAADQIRAAQEAQQE